VQVLLYANDMQMTEDWLRHRLDHVDDPRWLPVADPESYI